MASNNPSAFGSELTDDAHESAEAQFVTENICGEGAECTVYRARLDGLLVAIKRLSATQRLNPAYVAAYRKEFEIGRRLKHDALPLYRQFKATSDDVYIVMDFVDGITVSDFLLTPEGQNFFSDDHNLHNFLCQLLDAATYLHRSGVIHCDLKPANIMLRHTDRAVMVIDLDKAYCDTRDLTHGGTPGISDALSPTQRPTAAKDFAAIGRIIDIILSNRQKKSLPRSLRQFRHLCETPNISPERLRKALHPSRHPVRTIAVIIATLAAIAIIGIFLFPNPSKESTPAIPNATITPGRNETTKDTIIPAATPAEPDHPTPPEQNSPEAATQKTIPHPTTDSEADLDAGMKDYINETTSALAALRSGRLTDNDIQDIATRTSNLFYASYNKIREDYMKRHPQASEADSYNYLADVLSKSHAQLLMQTFCKELIDTINVRARR